MHLKDWAKIGTLWSLLSALVGLWIPSATGQDVPEATADSRFSEAFSIGVEAFQQERYEHAIPQLIRLVNARPAYVEPERGSAAYWLGRAFQVTGQPEAAAQAWEGGWIALARSGRIDLRLADALVGHVIEHQDSSRYATAEAAYLTLISQLTGAASRLHQLRARHLAPLALILPPSVQVATGLMDTEAASSGPLAADASTRLLAWWRRMDELPATALNERLIEHLCRIDTARRRYADAEAPMGFDDRGTVYVRFGAPYAQRTITFDAMALSRISRWEGGRLQVTSGTAVPAFPENEFWVYDHVDDRAQYLFIRHPAGPFHLGLPDGLLPPELRNGFASSTERTHTLLVVLEEMYRQLSLLHRDFGSRYALVANYSGLQQDLEFSAYLQPTPAADEGSATGTDALGVAQPDASPPESASLSTLQRPATFARQALSDAKAEDRRIARQRDAFVPASASNLLDAVERLPVQLRWARFLDADGTTRTEVYWAMQARELRPSPRFRKQLRETGHEPSGAYLLNLTAVQQAADFRDRLRQAKPHLITAPPDDETAVVPVQQLTVVGDTGRYHLAMQWDTYWAYHSEDEGADRVQLGPKLKIGALRLDSLDALSADPSRLEMSDLKPLRVTETVEDAVPYPHTVIPPERQLALYFEVYHLAFGTDDKTHYRVTYEVASQSGEGLLRLPGRRRAARTTARTSYAGDSRTAREAIVLDLSEWKGAGTLEIRVIVEDRTTGQTTERTLSFDVRE